MVLYGLTAMVGVYALASGATLAVGLFLARDALDDVAADDPPTEEEARALYLLQSYGDGFGRRILWALAVGLLCASVVALLAKAKIAVLFFSAGLLIDLALFLIWRDQSQYAATLTDAERGAETFAAVAVCFMLGCFAFLRITAVLT